MGVQQGCPYAGHTGHNYAKKLTVVVSSKIIDGAMKMIIKGELARAMEIWRQAHFGVVMSGLLQLPHQHAWGMELLPKEHPFHKLWLHCT